MKENTSMQTGMLNYQVSERSVQSKDMTHKYMKGCGLWNICCSSVTKKAWNSTTHSVSQKSWVDKALQAAHCFKSPVPKQDTLTLRQYLHPNIVPKAASRPWYNTQWLHKTITTWHGHSHGGRWLNIALLCTYMRHMYTRVLWARQKQRPDTFKTKSLKRA